MTIVYERAMLTLSIPENPLSIRYAYPFFTIYKGIRKVLIVIRDPI